MARSSCPPTGCLSTSERQCARRASGPSQHGPVIEPPELFLRRRDLLERGMTDHEIVQRLRGPEWRRLSRGRYTETAVVPSESALDRQVRVRAVADAVPSAVISHGSAALLLGLPLPAVPLGPVHLTRPGRSGHRTTASSVIHAAVLGDRDVVEHDGVRITSPDRTLVDLARTAPFDVAVAAADAALREKLVTPGDLEWRIGSVARGGRGVSAVRRVLLFADGRAESVGESYTRVALMRLGLPAPALQISVYDGSGRFLGRGDLGYEEAALLVEFDGMSKYHLGKGAPGDQMAREKVREDGFRAAGLTTVRVIWRDLAHPVALRRRMQNGLEIGRTMRERGLVTASWRTASRIGVER